MVEGVEFWDVMNLRISQTVNGTEHTHPTQMDVLTLSGPSYSHSKVGFFKQKFMCFSEKNQHK